MIVANNLYDYMTKPATEHIADDLESVVRILRRDMSDKQVQAAMAAWRLTDALGALSKLCPEGAQGIDEYTGLGYRLDRKE